MDPEKYLGLPTIIMLKEVIRKWWRLELSFADRQGQVVNQRQGGSGAARALFERFQYQQRQGPPHSRRAVLEDTHPQPCAVGVPVHVGDDYEGCLFVDGFGRSPGGGRGVPPASTAVLSAPEAGAAERAPTMGMLPLLDDADLQKLADLLEVAATEIANSAEPVPTLRADETPDQYRFENIVGKSGPMLEIFRLLEKVCNSDSTVLINGESGTGKELVARAIHYNGPRRDKPFVVQNCSAFNDNLLESALFGHVRGSFTGALRDKKGLFEMADGGTFFLDEVGDMSPTLQVKLLRVLQEGTFLPVGGTHVREVQVRVIAATHKDLSELVKRGEFREDLFYRINVIRVQVPPLRERKDDLPILIDHFFKKHRKEGQLARKLAPDALAVLQGYAWPGNIRELENEIERLLVLGSDVETIPADIISSRIRDSVGPTHSVLSQVRTSGKLGDAVELLEREMIQQGLVRTGNNKSRLARELGISRSNLILKIAKYGLERDGGDDRDVDSEEIPG